MNSQALTKPPTKAIDPTGKNSIMSGNLGKDQIQASLVGIRLTPEQVASLPVVQLSQQSMTINVQNVTINNYYSSPEATNRSHNEASQGKLDQVLQQAKPPSETVENKLGGLNDIPSNLNSIHTAHPQSQNGIGRRPNSSRRAKGQTPQAHDMPKVEKNPVRTKPSNGLAPSQLPLQASSKSTSATVAAAPVQEHVPREKIRPNNNKHTGLFAKILHPHSDRENSSKQRANMPASTAIPPAQGINSNHPNGDTGTSVVRKLQNHGGAQAQHHQSQALSDPTRASALGRQVLESSQGDPQLRRCNGAAGTLQDQSAVNQRARAAPEVAAALNDKDIEKGLDELNSRFGNFKIDRPARLIMVGKAAAKMMKLDNRDEAYHIDVILDLAPDDKRRRCMAHDTIAKVFREFDGPEPAKKLNSSTGAPAWGSFFRTGLQARATALRDIIERPEMSKCIFKKAHLQVYLMRKPRALKFELSRMADPSIVDEKVRRASGKIVVGLMWHEIQERVNQELERQVREKQELGKQERENLERDIQEREIQKRDSRIYRKWRSDIRMENGSSVSGALIQDVENLFKERMASRALCNYRVTRRSE